MNLKVKILIGILVVGILLIGGWWVWKSQHIPTELEISVDGKLETITDIHLPIDKIEAEKIVKKFCEPKNPNYDYGYNAIKKVNDEWRIPIYNLNCPCYAVVNIESGETNCMKQIPFETQEVTITTDKTEYEQGETVEIIVRNNLVESIWYREWDTKCSGTSFSIGKKRDNEYSFYPLGLAECAMDEVELKPKATRIYALNLNEWKKTKFPHTDIDTGVYKWRFIYILKNGDKESKTIYSNEFTIKEKKEASNANFSIKAKKYSSTLTITNTGDVVLTNIRIIKDRDFTKEGVIIHKEIIKVIPKLHVNESVNISIPEISSCGFLPEEENITASNEGWIIVTCDQGVTKKMVFCEVIPHTIN